ncbi:MAG: hypothetical protein JWN64_294 [Parcubacteria group bacterium]|nr:hypothetical protein [Parcubacteria group bacterium]
MRRFLITLALLALFTLPVLAYAQEATGLVPVCADGAPLGMGSVLKLLQNLINFFMGIIGVIATLMLVWAGALYMTSGANPESRGKANKILMNTMVGLLVFLSAWLVVDFVMKKLYVGEDGTSAEFGPWNSILTGGDACVKASTNTALFSGGLAGNFQNPTLNPVANPASGGTPTTPTPTTAPAAGADGVFTYQKGIEAQKGQASAKLNALLSCIANRVPANVGQISSISDSKIVSGSKTFAQCAAGGQGAGCAHTANSCHYGGKTCVGSSYAADFGDDQNSNVLAAAAKACGATYTGFEGTHLHVSIGASCGCN